ncbi:hypothetical protein ACT3SZ_06525 [Corynebacterium sp. AOP40-9SA-29]|uniref:hypothetical protein n=1 Tax=Corynebacterium sp. AOP40-9SA-29 TaxID=3457677 RepID=UPI004033B3E2
MTVLYGELLDVQGEPFDQQGTAVVISATQARPAMNSSALTLTELARIEMEDSGGLFETKELDPGPVIVRLEGGVSHGLQWEIGIPDDNERWNLADLIGEQVEWEPIVVSRAEAAARRAIEAAEQQVELYEDLDAIKTARDESGASASAAATSENNAATSEEEATTQASRSEAEADRSAEQARDAANSAGESAESAAASEASSLASSSARSAAGQSAAYADTRATDADGSARAADASRQAAATSESNAATSESNAAGSASSADQSATQARQTVTEAVADATATTAGHRDAAEAASERAASSESSARASRQAAAESAEAAADIAIGNVPGATGETRGLVKLGGDLAGTADAPTVPALALAVPGASVCLTPQAAGWGYATGDPAETRTGWSTDGTWLTPPAGLLSAYVTVDWCGGTAAALRGRRPDGSASTLATVPAGTPETHRPVTVLVDLTEVTALAVAATWEEEDLEAACTVSLMVQPLPEHTHSIPDINGLQGALQGKVSGNDPRLDDPREPLSHEHEIDQVRGLRDVVDRLTALEAMVRGRPVPWLWDGEQPWTPSEHALAIDSVWDLDAGEIREIEEVTDDE